MKFKCSQQILAKSLGTVSKAVAMRTTMPVLKGVLIEVKKDYIKLTATDLNIQIEKKLTADIESEGSVIVQFKLFDEIVRKIPSGDIEIEYIPNENNTEEAESSGHISISQGKLKFNIIGLSPGEFPTIRDGDEEKEKIILPRRNFKEMIRKTAFSASLDESKGIIVGILIEIEKEKLNMIAIDGFRMAILREALKNEKEKKIVIGAKILIEIAKIFSEDDVDDDIEMLVSDKIAVISMEDTKITLRLLAGEFIKYKSILPQESRTTVILRRDDLLDCMERAALLAKEGKNNLIVLKISDDVLEVTSKCDEGDLREEIIAEKKGDSLEIGFNSKYMIDVLKVIEEEEVKLELNTNITPCMIKPVEGESFEYLILPVRMN